MEGEEFEEVDFSGSNFNHSNLSRTDLSRQNFLTVILIGQTFLSQDCILQG